MLEMLGCWLAVRKRTKTWLESEWLESEWLESEWLESPPILCWHSQK